MKSVLTDAALLPELSAADRADANRIVALFEPERRQVQNILRLFFSLAGVSWFLIWFPEFFGVRDDVLEDFRVNQYQIYLILLTLWGFELKRQEKRIAYILNLATSLDKRWYHLSEQDFAQSGKQHLLEVITKKYPGNKKYGHLAFAWLLVGLTLVQFVRQSLLLWSA